MSTSIEILETLASPAFIIRDGNIAERNDAFTSLFGSLWENIKLSDFFNPLELKNLLEAAKYRNPWGLSRWEALGAKGSVALIPAFDAPICMLTIVRGNIEDELSAFFTNIDASVREQLACITTGNDLLKRELSRLKPEENPTPKMEHYIKVIEQSTLRISRICRNIRDIGRYMAGYEHIDGGNIDFMQFCVSVVDLCRPIAEERGVSLGFLSDVEGVFILGDQEKLRRMLLNLISNALLYGGDTCNVILRKKDNGLLITIKDNGKGVKQINPDFSDFNRPIDYGADPRKLGLGLGLALSRYIARLHGGDLFIDSSPEFGTCLNAYLPIGDILDFDPPLKDVSNDIIEGEDYDLLLEMSVLPFLKPEKE